MTEIKDELIARLEVAKARYVAGYQECEAATAEIKLMDGLIARFEELTADDTRAFPAVPADAVFCSRCGEDLHQRGNAWVDRGERFGCDGGPDRHVAASANGGGVDRLPPEWPQPAPAAPEPGASAPGAWLPTPDDTRPDDTPKDPS